MSDPDRVRHRDVARVTSEVYRARKARWRRRRLVFLLPAGESQVEIHEAEHAGIVLAVGQGAHALRHSQARPRERKRLGVVAAATATGRLVPVIALEELNQPGGVAPPRGQDESAGDLSEPGCAGDRSR